MTDHYDIAVLGGGLAGLSLLYHLQRAGKLDRQRVLLVDPAGRKADHDRSWSFWEKGTGPFEELVYRRWTTVTLHNAHRDLTCDIAPYAYKLIRSTEFYAHVNPVVDSIPGLERVTAAAENVVARADGVSFTVHGRACSATLAFSSVPLHLRPRQIKQPYLDQHFRGWFVETAEDTFDPTRAALMDFRTPQHGEARFFYVMPADARRALVEVAIFSNDHLTTAGYDRLLREYVRDYWTDGPYRITHTEAGNIPMTTYPFPTRDGNLIYIGMRGGATRPSTGYTFWGLQQQLSRYAAEYPKVTPPAPWPTRHLYYDATLLRILQDRSLAADELFVDLFARNPPARVLAFLNGSTSLGQELRLMASTEIGVFGPAFVRSVLA